MKIALLALTAFLSAANAAESDWRTAWDGTLYGYAGNNSLRGDSVLNPGNRIARLPQRSETAELRLNFRAENETLRLTARPIVSIRETSAAFASEAHGESYFSQWQLRVRVREGWNLAAGRDVLNWGPAQFRSPSSPFYFDNGRHDPMRELVGMDAVKLSWTPDLQNSVSLARIVRSGYGAAQPDQWRDSWLLKFDRRGDEWAYGLVLAKAPERVAFVGVHGQITVSDSLLVYGEAGSSSLAGMLQASTDAAQPFALAGASPRRSTALGGISYSFEDGQSLAAEYLHEGHGYTRVQAAAYFQRAVSAPGMALGFKPRLLGRDYLHLVWQSNMMDERGFWRLMYTRNLSDGGQEIAAYGEAVLNGRISAYLLAVLPQGDARQEFSALTRRSLTLGLKIALP